MTARLTRVRRSGQVLALGGLVAAAGCAPSMTLQQEAELGQQYAAEINRELPIVQDAQVSSYVNELGTSIVNRVDQRGLRYTFYVVNSEAVNAFAVPGGYIYVNRGLIERATNASEFAGVLAHEIAHVVERHSAEQLQRAQNANLMASVVYGVLLGREPSGVEQVGLQVGGSAYFASYSRSAEREADMEAVDYLVRSGYHPGGLTTFFRKLLDERERRPAAVEQWFSTHPLTEDRITEVEQRIAQVPSSSLRNLRRDTDAYQQFRRRVSQLSPPPR